jgi:hypothetical protein
MTPHDPACPRYIHGGSCTCDRDGRELRRLWPSPDDPPPFFGVLVLLALGAAVCAWVLA